MRHGDGAAALSAVAAPRLPLDLGAPISLARPVRFDGGGPRHFGAPAARARPYAAPGFSGDVRRGASCNCATIELTPHCNGTHTESVGHLVEEPLDVCDLVPLGLLPALVLRSRAADTLEAHAVTYRDDPADPYLSRQLVSELVARGIEHLVVDLPSIDRSRDGGRLCAHRLFFGLPTGSTRLADATRQHCTVTEYASIPAALSDGPCALQLTLPRLAGDAVPSRPLAFRLAAP